jgi:hypothetical protein
MTAAVMIGVIVAGAWFASPTLRHQIRLSVSRQATPFTELAFGSDLPASFTVGAPTALQFTITNHETSAVTYAWTATATGSDGSTVNVEHGTLDLTRGASGVATTSFTAPSTGTYTVTITLDGRPETIHVRRSA